MRFAASALSCVAAVIAVASGSEAEQMADGIRELGPVQREEMEGADAAPVELAAELRGHGGGDELAGSGELVQAFIEAVEPGRDARPADRRELAGLGDIGDREDARRDLGSDP